MSTAPFDAAVAQLITETHQQRVTARAVVAGTTIDLPLIDYTVDNTERRTPRWSAILTTPIPDEATLNLLDPRTYVRVTITAGYRLPGGDWDDVDVVALCLRAREVDRPRDTLTLTCASHEALILDRDVIPQHPNDYGTFTTNEVQWSPSGSAMVKLYWEDMLYELRQGPLADLVVVDEVRSGPSTVVINPGSEWDRFESVAEQEGFDMFDDGSLTLRLAPRPALSATTAHDLSVGANGTILESSAAVDRDDWANYVVLRYHWVDKTSGQPVDSYVYGSARVKTGPYAPDAAGWRYLVEDREGRPSQAAADRAAATILTRLLSRSRSLRLEAVSAWWLRAGHTVTVQLPQGPQERHLVAGVIFRAGDRMTVVTRLPDAVSTIGA